MSRPTLPTEEEFSTQVRGYCKTVEDISAIGGPRHIFKDTIIMMLETEFYN